MALKLFVSVAFAPPGSSLDLHCVAVFPRSMINSGKVCGFVLSESRKKFASVLHLVTGHLVERSFFLQKRLARLALTDANGTTGFQAATGGRIERKNHFSLQR